VPKGKEKENNRGKQPAGEHDILVQRATSIGRRLKEFASEKYTRYTVVSSWSL
jgi:hypothetical protein